MFVEFEDENSRPVLINVYHIVKVQKVGTGVQDNPGNQIVQIVLSVGPCTPLRVKRAGKAEFVGARLRATAPASAARRIGRGLSPLNAPWLTQRSPLTRLRHQGARVVAARL